MSIPARTGDAWVAFVTTRSPVFRDELIVAYAPLVRHVIGRLGIPSTSVIDRDDLLAQGVVGLIHAIDSYDPSRGVRFEALATAHIRGAVMNQLGSDNLLLPLAAARVRQMEGALEGLEKSLKRSATEEEIAAALNISVDRYRHMLEEAGTVVQSLDTPLSPLL